MSTCQICGSPMYYQSSMGLFSNGAAEYCRECYRNGNYQARHFELNFFGPTLPYPRGF